MEENERTSRAVLAARAGLFYLCSLVFVGGLLFVTAGSFEYWNAWLYICAMFVPMLVGLVFLLMKEPDLLQRRLKTKEKEKPQKLYLVFSLVMCFAGFTLPGLDHRYAWSDVPVWLVIMATVTMLAGYSMFFIVMRQNRYASRVIEIQESQKVIDTGLYSVVRHPMYLAATIMYLSSAFVLGSYYALIPLSFIPVLLIIRIHNEERVLMSGLSGYSDYMKRVRYRLIPFVW